MVRRLVGMSYDFLLQHQLEVDMTHRFVGWSVGLLVGRSDMLLSEHLFSVDFQWKCLKLKSTLWIFAQVNRDILSPVQVIILT